jgi:hypothetical protein
MGDPLAPVDTTAAGSNLLPVDGSLQAQTAAVALPQTGAGNLGPSAAPTAVGPAPGGASPVAVSLADAANIAEQNATAALHYFQTASRDLESEVKSIRASFGDELLVADAYRHVELLQRSAIATAAINRRDQQALADSLTDPTAIARQGERIAVAESLVRQAGNDKPIGIAEGTQAGLRPLIEEYQLAHLKLLKFQDEISQEPNPGEDSENRLAELSVRVIDAENRVSEALDRNIAKWREANAAAEIANQDGRHEDVRISRAGYFRAMQEAWLWNDNENIADPALRGAVEALRKAEARLERATLAISDKHIIAEDGAEDLAENLHAARNECDQARDDLNLKLDRSEIEKNDALIAAEVASRAGTHGDLERARSEFNEMQMATEVLRNTFH